jgi:hypothetical protein
MLTRPPTETCSSGHEMQYTHRQDFQFVRLPVLSYYEKTSSNSFLAFFLLAGRPVQFVLGIFQLNNQRKKRLAVILTQYISIPLLRCVRSIYASRKKYMHLQQTKGIFMANWKRKIMRARASGKHISLVYFNQSGFVILQYGVDFCSLGYMEAIFWTTDKLEFKLLNEIKNQDVDNIVIF